LKISIITVSYNSAETIRDTIESVIAQSYPNIEYIVIDGASKDATLDIIREYSDKISIIVSEPDKGIYDAMNKGIKMATGDVVGILNSDDVFYDNNSVKRIVEGFGPGIDAVYADLMYVNRNDLDRPSRFYSSKNFSFAKVRFGIMLPHPTFYVKRELFDKLGFYKTDYRVAADFELIARFLANKINFTRIPVCLVKMREGGISSSDMKGRIHQNFEIVRACKENNIYTNIFMVMLKLPFKLFSYLKR